MINRIITQYLAGNKRLILPDFGAFIRKDDTGEVIFMEFLKKDDGVFASLVAAEMGVGETEARDIVRQYISDLRTRVAASGSFVIEGLGRMKMDINGIFSLEFNPKASIAAEKSTQMKADIPAAVAQAVKAATPQPRTHPEQKPISMESAAKENDIPHPEQRHINVVPVMSAQPKVDNWQQTLPAGIPVSRVNTVESTGEIPVIKPATDAFGSRVAHPKREYATQGKKKADYIVIIAVLAAIIAIGSMIYEIFVDSDPIMKMQPTAPVVQPMESGDGIDNPEEPAGQDGIDL